VRWTAPIGSSPVSETPTINPVSGRASYPALRAGLLRRCI
jgi:hypothetical protein